MGFSYARQRNYVKCVHMPGHQEKAAVVLRTAPKTEHTSLVGAISIRMAFTLEFRPVTDKWGNWASEQTSLNMNVYLPFC